MMSRTQRRLAFTLIELLIVISIIGILIGSISVAVTKARALADRSRCASNLSQIGLAVRTYESVHGQFPMGVVDGGGQAPLGISDNGVGHSWVPFILAYIEQEPLGRSYRWDSNFNSAANLPITSTRLPLLECVSAPNPRKVGWGGATSDYASVRDVDADLVGLGLVAPMADNKGLLARNQFTHVAAVVDGLSNTILIAECAGRNEIWHRGIKQPGSVGGGPWSAQTNRLIIMGSTPDGKERGVGNATCGVNCTNEHEIYSFHSGGANVVMGDRSVRFLSENLNIRILANLVTRAGGEVPAAEE